MRIVIDLQACQNSSRFRGIGRYAMAISKAILKAPSNHEFFIILNASFEAESLDVRSAFSGLLPANQILSFHNVSHATAADRNNSWRNAASESVRTNFLRILAPDIVFIPSLFEGLWDDTNVCIASDEEYLSVVTLFDLIPLDDLGGYLGDRHSQQAYFRRLNDLRRADLILPISNYVSVDAQRRLSIPQAKLRVVTCGVDTHFRPPITDRDAALTLTRYGIKSPYIITASPLEARKNIEGLIAGFAALDPEIRKQHQLVLIGKMDDFAQDYLCSLAQNEGIDEQALLFPGFVPDDDLVILYANCSVFAFPSFSEGFGLPLLEAMACGAPVIGSNTTSIPEVVGRADLLVDPHSARSIAEGLQRILTNEDLRAELKKFGVQRSQMFTWEESGVKALQAMEEVYLKWKRSKPAPLAPTSWSGRPKLAILLPHLIQETYLAGISSPLISALCESFQVTIFHGPGELKNQWITSNCAIFGLDEYAIQSADFDCILFICEPYVDKEYFALLENFGGSVLLVDSDNPPKDVQLVGPDMGFISQKALCETFGFACMQDAVEASISIPLVKKAIVGAFDRVSDRLLIAGLGDLRHLPIDRASAGRSFFRSQYKIDDQAELVVIITDDNQHIPDILQFIRHQEDDGEQISFIILDCTNDSTGKPAVRIFGDITLIRSDLSAHYSAIISAADIVLSDLSSASIWSERLKTDVLNGRLIYWPEKHTLKNALALIRSSYSRQKNNRDILDVTGIEGNDEAASIVRDWLLTAGKQPHLSLRKLVRNFYPKVRGIKPSAGDLISVVNATVANEAILRPPYIFVDVTAFATRRADCRLDTRSRRWLQALLKNAQANVRALYIDGDRFLSANKFIMKLLGLRTPALSDDEIFMRAGDKLLGVDLWPCFAASHHAALKKAQSLGVLVNYVSLSGLWPMHNDQLASFAEAILDWVRLETQFESAASFVPVVSRFQSSVREMALDPTLLTILENNFACQFLLNEAEICRNATQLRDISEKLLPTCILEAFSKLQEAATAGVDVGSHSMAKFGHVMLGHMLGNYSLAIINRTLAATLETHLPGQVRFVPMESERIDHTEGVPEDEKALMIALSERPANPLKGEIVISHHYPVLVPIDNYAVKIALFFWEESLVPPEVIARLVDNFDAVISPTQVVTRALLDSGLSIPIATIGQPVDVDEYRLLQYSRSSRDAKFTFLHVSSCFNRKGVDALLLAWSNAFSASDSVQLLIKTFPNPHNDIEAQVARLREMNPNIADIIIVNEDVSATRMLHFYESADAMVLPSRGEGYNLPALEAMAAGVPLIVTAHGGQRDFCNDGNARLIECKFSPTESHVGSAHSLWVEPDVGDLVDALREQIDPDHSDEIEMRRVAALKSAAVESDSGAWVARYGAMLDGLLRGDVVTPTPSVAWISTWGVECGIAQYSRYLIDNFSAELRRNIVVICDKRTKPGAKGISYLPIWDVKNVPKVEDILISVKRSGASAVVLQHQDGLLSWKQLGELANDERLDGIVTVLILHNANNMMRAETNERNEMLAGLRKMTRILVHSISDLNLLYQLGVKDNIALLPHGATASQHAPWPRRLSDVDAPVIGCHGFFFRHKGIDKLIKAVALLRGRWPNIKLRLVNARFPEPGHDQFIEECKALASELGMESAIEWHQDFLPIERIGELLGSCDVISLPYDESDDSASGAVRVALSTMVPLVATRVKIFSELGDAASWVESNDPTLLADAIDDLLASVEARRAVQSSMYDWLKAHDWQSVGSRLEGMMKGLSVQKQLGWDRGRDI